MLAEMAFRGSWRDYQTKVLERLDLHLEDRRLHVVAAPGAGKTILGLEVVRRIGRPVIVLAPTVAIRDQWVDRLCGMFLADPGGRPDWLSTSLAEPGPFTVTTYQALHAASRGVAEPEIEDSTEDQVDAAAGAAAGPGLTKLAAYFAAIGPVTLVLDEAHHLRRAWWLSLSQLQAVLPDVRIVSLTATPPYDVEHSEWLRYEALCGPVDAEIAVPELVRNGELCPHQDYLHVSLPTDSEEALLAERLDGLDAILARLREDPEFSAMLLAHPWLAAPEASAEQMLDAPEFVSAMLAFLVHAGEKPPRAVLDLLGVSGGSIPPLSLQSVEILLDGLLFAHGEGLEAWAETLRRLRQELRGLGLVRGGRVVLVEDRIFFTLLAGSLGRIGSVVEIARAESASLATELRMVVLADRVCREDLPSHAGAEWRPARLGVAPLFEALRRDGIPLAKLGVLTGSLVIIPSSALPALELAADEAGIPGDSLPSVPLAHDPSYRRLDAGGPAGHRLVQLVTRLFEAGEVNLLVGTQALLGEGWDAPSVNTLVLASNVGSYMLSNQMRGRAIRIDPARPDKAANIWHLATIVPETVSNRPRAGFGWFRPEDPFDPAGGAAGPDMDMLKRRFLAFDGVTHCGEPRIESGLSRLGLAGTDWTAAGAGAVNAEMLERSTRRAELHPRWKAAIGEPAEHRQLRQVLRASHEARVVSFADTLAYLAMTALLGGAASAANAMRDRGAAGTWTMLLLAFLGLTLFYALPKLGRAAYLLARNGTLERNIAAVGQAVIDGLDHAGLFARPADGIVVRTERSALGKCLIHIENVSRAEERMILASLEEALGPVRNPRYLLVRESPFLRWLQVDYHAVPSAIGRKKQDAEHFAARWNARVGRARLVYLRTPAGRRLLLRARARSLAAGFRSATDRLSAWQ